MAVVADFRARITRRDEDNSKIVHRSVRFVFSDGSAAIWSKEPGTKKASRDVFVPSGATFHKAKNGRIAHELELSDGTTWEIRQLPPTGCGCSKVAAGYSYTQLLEQDFHSTP